MSKASLFSFDIVEAQSISSFAGSDGAIGIVGGAGEGLRVGGHRRIGADASHERLEAGDPQPAPFQR